MDAKICQAPQPRRIAVGRILLTSGRKQLYKLEYPDVCVCACVRVCARVCACVRVCARVYSRKGQTVKPETTKGTLCLQKRAVGSAFRVMSSYYSNSARVMRLGAPRIFFRPDKIGATMGFKKNAKTTQLSRIRKSQKNRKKNRKNTFLPEIRH